MADKSASLKSRFSGRILSPEDFSSLIHCSTIHSFQRNDTADLPAGWEAILVSEGVFSPVFREGKTKLSEQDIRDCTGFLYFIRLSPNEAMMWGKGGLRVKDMTCGMNGSLRLEVVSSRKLLSAFIDLPMPVTADQIFDQITDPVLDVICSVFRSLSRTEPVQGLENRLALEAAAALEEPLETYGLAVVSLTVSEIFISSGS